jgi:hypothetical protein
MSADAHMLYSAKYLHRLWRGGVFFSNGHSMNKPLQIIVLIIVPLLILTANCFALFGCAGETLKASKAASPEREAIKASLVAFEEAWNMHDESELLHLLHDDFIVWEKGRRRILYSKSKFAFYLRDIMRNYRYLGFGRPAMWLKSDRATVRVPMSIDGRPSTSIFTLIKEEDKWFFLDWEF